MDLFCKFTPVPPPGSWKMCTNSWGMRCHALNQKSCGLGGWEEDCIFSSSWHGIIFPCAERPKGKNKIVTGFDVRETTSVWLFIDCKVAAGCWLYAKCGKRGWGGGSMERTGPGGRGGVDFISLHHWADTVLTQAGRIKAQGKAVISQCMCACKNICVSLLSHPW